MVFYLFYLLVLIFYLHKNILMLFSNKLSFWLNNIVNIIVIITTFYTMFQIFIFVVICEHTQFTFRNYFDIICSLIMHLINDETHLEITRSNISLIRKKTYSVCELIHVTMREHAASITRYCYAASPAAILAHILLYIRSITARTFSIIDHIITEIVHIGIRSYCILTVNRILIDVK